MFLEIDKKDKEQIAVIDDHEGQMTYGDLVAFTRDFKAYVEGRSLIFCLCKNQVGALAGYVASMSMGAVPLMLSADMDTALLKHLGETYKPAYYWAPEDIENSWGGEVVFKSSGYLLYRSENEVYPINEALAMLLTTSGSTGSPKLVRHELNNIESSARNVALMFKLDEHERAVAFLPLQYTMGLSLVNSHLFAGGTVLLMSKAMTDRRFWSFIKDHRATSITGVPYSYEIMTKLRFFRMDLPHLKLISQGGGKLTDDLFRQCCAYAQDNDKSFVATYGQTEGTARMAYLPAEMASEKIGSIGIAIPQGRFELVDEDKQIIEEANVAGELVYYGPNVTLGYARKLEDLELGDERHGVLFTGDLATRDEDGCYYIVGRRSRFLKIYGLRVNLGEVERLIKSEFEIACACTGDDTCMKVFIEDERVCDSVHKFIVAKTGIFGRAIKVTYISEIPKNDAGKIMYKALTQ